MIRVGKGPAHRADWTHLPAPCLTYDQFENGIIQMVEYVCKTIL